MNGWLTVGERRRRDQHEPTGREDRSTTVGSSAQRDYPAVARKNVRHRFERLIGRLASVHPASCAPPAWILLAANRADRARRSRHTAVMFEQEPLLVSSDGD